MAKFTADEKLQAALSYLEGKESFREIAKSIGTDHKAIQNWVKQYRHTLEFRGIVQSMSRKGNCYDSSVMENFFGILKSEFLYLKEFESVERIKAKLKLSPVQYRTQFIQAA